MKSQMRRTLQTLMLIVSLVATLSAGTVHAGSPMATYEVTITNMTVGQPFTPPVIATHNRGFRMFEVGRAASEEVKEIAENGNLAPLVAAVENSPKVSDFVVAVAGDPPPLMPGSSVTVEINASRSAKVLSFVSMLICTNDGFVGVDRMNLPRNVGDVAVANVGDYDAGTEINTEDLGDIVPPCAPLTGVSTTKPGTGMSNPALAENGVITQHGGVFGSADLIPAIHNWTSPVSMITITRTN